jgi:hypothetical protein
MTSTYKLYYEGMTPYVEFDGAPDESHSRSSGISTDTTISKKTIFWFGSATENLSINGKYISGEQKALIDEVLDYIKDNETYAYFEDGVYTYKIIDLTFTTTDIPADVGIAYEYSLNFIILDKELIEEE